MNCPSKVCGIKTKGFRVMRYGKPLIVCHHCGKALGCGFIIKHTPEKKAEKELT